MRRLRYYIGILALETMLFAACGSNQNPPLPTEAPQNIEEPEATPTPEPTATPKPTEKPTPTPMGTNLPEGINLLNTYGKTFGKIGVAISARDFSDQNAIALIKENYNSITMGNEMKPDSILDNSVMYTVEEAKALGYVIPENYKEATVPKLNFYYTDRALEFCVENNLGLRGHTLVWHEQTPNWFFKEGYALSGATVSPEVMDARVEFYIRSVMGHVCESENGHVLYSWDVVNEYVHANSAGWKEVYGNESLTPGYVKLAFQVADDVLRQYEIRDKVSLVYNDFNTYSDAKSILTLLEFVNADGKICDTVGMQSHLTANNPPVIKFKLTVEDFLEAGYSVQMTELDIGNSNPLTQATYAYSLMKALLEIKQAGGDIQGITYWGLSDVTSWRKTEKPLLFTTITTPKLGYYKVLEAYVDMGLYEE